MSTKPLLSVSHVRINVQSHYLVPRVSSVAIGEPGLNVIEIKHDQHGKREYTNAASVSTLTPLA